MSRTTTPKTEDKLNPRQIAFLSYYLDPGSKTFGNALRSALKAGFKQEYAENITHHMPAWLAENVGDHVMVSKAERNLVNILDLETEVPVVGMFGPIHERIPTGKKDKKGNPITRKGKLVVAENPKLLAIKTDVSKFVAERLNKKRFSLKAAIDLQLGGKIQFVVPVEIKAKHAIPSNTESSSEG